MRLDEDILPITLKSQGLYGGSRITDFDVHESNVYFSGFKKIDGKNRPFSFTLDTILNETCYNQDYTLNTFEVNNWMNAFTQPSAFSKTIINLSQLVISNPTYVQLVDEYEQVEYCPIDECLVAIEIVQEDVDACEGASLQFECIHEYAQNIDWYLDGVALTEVYGNKVYFDINAVGVYELIVEASNSFCSVFDTVNNNCWKYLDKQLEIANLKQQELDKYRPQLQRYRELFLAMGEQDVRAGLLFTDSASWVEL